MGVVAISRQVGSWGDEIASLVAGKLGYQFVGRNEIHTLAQSCDRDFKDSCTLFEAETQPSFFERIFFSNPAHTSLFESLTYELAARDNVVLVGRGVQIALADIPGVFRARVVAPREVRIKRVKDREGLTVDQAVDFVRDHDRNRRALIQLVYQRDLTDLSLYDLVLNTHHYSPDAGAEVIAAAFRARGEGRSEAGLPQRLKRMALAKRVESAIKKKVATTTYRSIEVSVDDQGRLELNGFVYDKDASVLAQKIAAEQPGVAQVRNKLRTTGLSW